MQGAVLPGPGLQISQPRQLRCSVQVSALYNTCCDAVRLSHCPCVLTHVVSYNPCHSLVCCILLQHVFSASCFVHFLAYKHAVKRGWLVNTFIRDIQCPLPTMYCMQPGPTRHNMTHMELVALFLTPYIARTLGYPFDLHIMNCAQARLGGADVVP